MCLIICQKIKIRFVIVVVPISLYRTIMVLLIATGNIYRCAQGKQSGIHIVIVLVSTINIMDGNWGCVSRDVTTPLQTRLHPNYHTLRPAIPSFFPPCDNEGAFHLTDRNASSCVVSLMSTCEYYLGSSHPFPSGVFQSLPRPILIMALIWMLHMP